MTAALLQKKPTPAQANTLSPASLAADPKSTVATTVPAAQDATVATRPAHSNPQQHKQAKPQQAQQSQHAKQSNPPRGQTPAHNVPSRHTIAPQVSQQPSVPVAQAVEAARNPISEGGMNLHVPATDNGFAALGLRAELVRAVLAHGYTTPTPIQTQAIPVVLKGGDVLGGAQTGTGKTAGFVLPMLQRLIEAKSTQAKSKAPRVLVLTPTRELAAQVEESVTVYGKFTEVTSTVIFGGVGMPQQVAALRKGVDVVVATPGRLLDHHGQRTIDLSKVEILVLDEADRMLDMGFIHDIKKVLAVLPPKRQNLLFSATFSDEIKALADRLLNSPALIEVARRNSTIEIVEQSVVLAERSQKSKLLARLIIERNWQQVLVFTRTKHGANRLAEQLSKSEIPALAIHGNKSQGARTRALSEFKSGVLRVLVATDIAARGIDIDQLPQVVNFEIPNVPEDYVHRIGRTGRAGMSGHALSLVSSDEMPLLKDIERFIKQQIPRIEITGFKANAPEAPDENDRSLNRGGRAPSGRTGNANGRGHTANRNTQAPRGSASPPRNSKNFQVGNRNTGRGRV